MLAIPLMLGIEGSHPFLQGNKRFAFAALEYFLYLKGYDLAMLHTIAQNWKIGATIAELDYAHV